MRSATRGTAARAAPRRPTRAARGTWHTARGARRATMRSARDERRAPQRRAVPPRSTAALRCAGRALRPPLEPAVRLHVQLERRYNTPPSRPRPRHGEGHLLYARSAAAALEELRAPRTTFRRSVAQEATSAHCAHETNPRDRDTRARGAQGDARLTRMFVEVSNVARRAAGDCAGVSKVSRGPRHGYRCVLPLSAH